MTTYAKLLKNPMFSHLYIEKAARAYPLTAEILKKLPNAVVVDIERYKDVFYRKNQSFRAQKESPALILAVNKDRRIQEGSRFCQSFGQEAFYYDTSVMNCPYDCAYCYLQGIYPSAHMVVFVNVEDTLAQVKPLLDEKPVFLCVSYDSDLLALEWLTGFVAKWLDFARENPNCTLEIRTKSAAFSHIAHIPPLPNVILAWTLSPQGICQGLERRAPSLEARLKSMKAAVLAGWPVRLCFEPLLYTPDWQDQYAQCVDTVSHALEGVPIHDVTLGTFRMSPSALNKVKALRSYDALFAYPFTKDGGYTPEHRQHMVEFMETHLRRYVAKVDIWVYDEGTTQSGTKGAG